MVQASWRYHILNHESSWLRWSVTFSSSMQELATGKHSRHQISWCIATEDGRWSSLVLLYDPAQDKKYTVDSKVLASKYGWVLFAKRENDEEEYPYMTNSALFLYTLSLIGLFTSRILYWSWMTKQHFLCLQILQIVRLDRDKKLLIRMCRPGETTWIKLAIFKFFDTEDSSEKYGPAHNVEYVDGVLYSMIPNYIHIPAMKEKILSTNTYLNPMEICYYIMTN